MNCTRCNCPMAPGELWGTWRCPNRSCYAYARNIVPKPLQTPFHRRHWSQKKAKSHA